MTRVINQQSAENVAYVRRLLGRRQPGFSAALELALTLAETELICPELSCDISAADSRAVYGPSSPAAPGTMTSPSRART